MKRLQIDWSSYFKEFCRLHGPPVEYKGRQIFPDGWGYAIKDHKGPEYSPPEDPKELQRLKIRYWLIKTRTLRAMFSYLKNEYEGLKNLQLNRSAPLQTKVTYFDSVGKKVVEYEELNFQMIEDEISLIGNELKQSLDKLQSVLGDR